MGLKELVVEDLFGEFTHKILLRPQEGLTLIHGPNGVGKTTVLRIVDAFFNQRYSLLRRLPFGALHLTLTTDDRMQVTRKPSSEKGRSRPVPGHSLEIISLPAKGRSHTWTVKGPAGASEVPAHYIDEFLPELARVASHQWVDTTSGETLDIEQILDKYADRLPFASHQVQETPEWLTDFIHGMPVYFIEAQRLQSFASLRGSRYSRVRADGPRQIPTVSLHAEDLSEKIKKTLADYGDYSQALDSTFPTRLLELGSRKSYSPLSQEEIRNRYRLQADRRSRYVRAGLLDAGDELTLPDRELDDSERRVLSTYMDDVDSKLAQLDDLADKLELFLSIVNGKFRRKSLSVDREHGFRVTTSDGERLELSSLSSGEQQEIVLAYGLLFRETPGTLVLIDEPELSLHVSWQLDFIPDLLKIAELAQLEFLVATHSPQVIGERWDLTVELNDGA